MTGFLTGGRGYLTETWRFKTTEIKKKDINIKPTNALTLISSLYISFSVILFILSIQVTVEDIRSGKAAKRTSIFVEK